MRHLVLDLAPSAHRPPYLRVADALIGAIASGRLRPGDRLPGTRALARQLGLHRNTVDAGYQEAIHQGWLTPRPSSGTFVADDLPDAAPAVAHAGQPVRMGPAPATAAAVRPPVGAAALPVAPRPHLAFTDGSADARLLPAGELARAFRRALARTATRPTQARMPEAEDDARGTPALRAALADHLAAERGLSFAGRDLLVARGSQMALFLAAQALVRPGAAIAVEAPGYAMARQAFRAAGARVVPVPVDAGGLSVAALARLLDEDPAIRAVYVTPHHQYPTTVTMGAARRLRLLELARTHDLTLIEDDYDHDYRFEGAPVLPLAARGDGAGIVYVGSLSKLLAPGIRLGYVVADAGRIARMARLRAAIDRQGDAPLEQAVAALLRDGELTRHARKARRVYQARRDRLIALLEARLPGALAVGRPAGGLALWARIVDGTDAAGWIAAAARLGLGLATGDEATDPAREDGADPVAEAPGAAFAPFSAAPSTVTLPPAPQPPQAFRLGYAALNEAELEQAVALLARAHAQVSSAPSSPLADAAPMR